MPSFFIRSPLDWTPFIQAEVLPRLQSGTILALSGPLGAGKTTFVQYLVTALGGEASFVKSPTFTLMRSYKVSHGEITRALHIDAYRFESVEEARILNLEEELEVPGTIACIEWAEKLEEMLQAHATRIIRLSLLPEEDGRRVSIVDRTSSFG